MRLPSVRIYSRITGYYRPVSNWNAGKSQEFEDRNTYNSFKQIDVAKQATKKTAEIKEAATDIKAAANVPSDAVIGILTTEHCPKCHATMQTLGEKGIPYKEIPFETDEGNNLAVENGIMSAPALIKPDGNILKNYADITAYVESL